MCHQLSTNRHLVLRRNATWVHRHVAGRPQVADNFWQVCTNTNIFAAQQRRQPGNLASSMWHESVGGVYLQHSTPPLLSSIHPRNGSGYGEEVLRRLDKQQSLVVTNNLGCDSRKLRRKGIWLLETNYDVAFVNGIFRGKWKNGFPSFIHFFKLVKIFIILDCLKTERWFFQPSSPVIHCRFFFSSSSPGYIF